jgi:thiamine-phosphate pyrophosphorylase
VVETVRAACAGGAGAVQLRRKGDDALETLRLAERCRELTDASGALFIVNDRADIAMASGADGVHLGQDDLSVGAVRRLWPDGLIGRSTHSLEQALEAQREGADYAGVGPVFATPTKPGRPPVGLDPIRAAASSALAIPWVAIGGIDAGNAAAVLAAGAPGVAVVRAAVDAADVEAAVATLLELIAARPAAGGVMSS